MSRIICISREYGSGGHEIAEKAAALLGIPCLDKQLMERIISSGSLPRELLNEVEEKVTNPFLYTSVYHGSKKEFYGMAPSDIVFELQKRHIIEQADKGDCIIVGRCAEAVLKNTGHLVVNVFITAPLSYRIQRIQQEMPDMDRRRIEVRVRQMDKRRKAYYEYHTGSDWGLPYNYDVCLNSASMGTERIAVLIAESFEKIIRKDDEK